MPPMPDATPIYVRMSDRRVKDVLPLSPRGARAYVTKHGLGVKLGRALVVDLEKLREHIGLCPARQASSRP